jgi:hypothetical protein
MITNADRAWFGKLVENTHNAYLQGHDNYPTSPSLAYSLLTNYQSEPRNLMRMVGLVSNGVSTWKGATLCTPMMADLPKRRQTSCTSRVTRKGTTPTNVPTLTMMTELTMNQTANPEQPYSWRALRTENSLATPAASFYNTVRVLPFTLARMAVCLTTGFCLITSQLWTCSTTRSFSRTFGNLTPSWRFTVMQE